MKGYCVQGHFGPQKCDQGHPHYNQLFVTFWLLFIYLLLKSKPTNTKNNSKRPIRPAVRSVIEVPHEPGPQ